jgi:hypothetical protein
MLIVIYDKFECIVAQTKYVTQLIPKILAVYAQCTFALSLTVFGGTSKNCYTYVVFRYLIYLAVTNELSNTLENNLNFYILNRS